ncbi:PAS domain-containing sensor histidine kinase [Maribacter sp. ACAM166]|uniref:PAS domain-containing sensor histidine kinase n=1 Tax=Maribacter sp. ACAM166 TaxID=2508996 RepID=UPI0010FCEA1A|nr:PAS domain-containing sensor histidine kinase [Maribacter sp. ACAM166]TLP73212.1 PAS domain S-box protein [Maribacter sp. ACAM166]
MKTLSIDFLLKETPSAIALVDTKLNFINYSTQWQINFTSSKINLIGEQLFNIISERPILFDKAIQSGLDGKENSNDGQKFILPSGKVQWLKWKISPWKNDENTLSGLMIFLEDITVDKKEIELLHKMESVSRVGGWEVDLQKNTLYWTQTTKDIHEVDEDFIPDLSQGLNFYKEGIHREKITRLVGSAIEEGKPFDTELIIQTAKGNEIWVRAKGEIETMNDNVIRIIGTFQDIDQRKKLELAHKEISQRLKIATQTTQIGIWEYDLKKNNLVWDDEMYKIFGINKNEISGIFEAWESTLHPDDKERALIATNDAINGVKDFDEEFRIKLQDGSIRHIKGLSKTIENLNGEAVKMTGANWDITELRSTELRLERSRDSFTETFDNATIGMALVALNGAWIKANNSLCKSLGYTEKEILKLTFQELTHPNDLYTDLELLNEVVEGKRESYQLEKRFFHKKGQLVHVILTVTVVRAINGGISHFIAQAVDITARIETEKKLNSLLEVTKSQNESLMNFAHIVSHNLRSHSTNMTMLSKFLTVEEDENERKNINGMITNAAESLAETIAHLNDVVQVKTGTLENLKRISVLNTLRQIQKSIEGLLDEQNAILKIDVPKSHFVSAVPAYLESIFLNILTNALKYSAKDRTPVIEIKSKVKKENILITFSDNGQGIDLKRHGDKIFGMYKTFHQHKDAKGIGLFITKNQIEAMSGNIRIESIVNQGTTIFIELKQS